MLQKLKISSVEVLSMVNIDADLLLRMRFPKNLKAYVAIENGAFQTVRHRDWRWFDFLWMTHTMDYQGRDNFNTLILRAFSLLGLITVLSGFLLWFTSSPTIRKISKNKHK